MVSGKQHVLVAIAILRLASGYRTSSIGSSRSVPSEDLLEDTVSWDEAASLQPDTDSRGVIAPVVQPAKCATVPQTKPGRRVVSVADQHGDFAHMLQHLQALGLVKQAVSREKATWVDCWAGGDAIFVQTGDILDRGPDGKLMYEFLWALQDAASEASPAGEVVLLIGNHELMVFQGDVRYVSSTDFCAYASPSCSPSEARYCDTDSDATHDRCCTHANNGCHTPGFGCMEGNCDYLAAWDIDGYMGKQMRKRFEEGKMKVFHRVRDIVFVHAGLVSSMFGKMGASVKGDILEAMNDRARDLFVNSTGRDIEDSRDFIAGSKKVNGPLWTRICYDDWYTHQKMKKKERALVQDSPCKDVAVSLDMVGATRIVIGHCPRRGKPGRKYRSPGIEAKCGGRFLLADTFMSVAYALTDANAVHNMAALEFFTGDVSGAVWAVYSGRPDEEECERLP